MSILVPPHGGGELAPLLVHESGRAEIRDRADTLTHVSITSREAADLAMLGMGAYTPLAGFMGKADWRRVCKKMKLENGVFWPIPITVSCSRVRADAIQLEDEIALVDADSGDVLAVMIVTEKYKINKKYECKHVYRTTDAVHPGVASVMAQGEINLGGPVRVLSAGPIAAEFPDLVMGPFETRALFEKYGWAQVAAFQTRNPMHRSHEHMVTMAMDVCDGVLIHQVLGKLKPGDIPAAVRVKAVDTVVKRHFSPGTWVQAGVPLEMRYAGPREALLHAVFRQNFGCSHLIVGRDHAGIGDFYGPFDAHQIFDALRPDALHIEALKFGITFYCHRCAGMATNQTCAHEESDRLQISGTRLREMFKNHEDIPPEFSRPEGVAVLRDYYDSLRKQG
ncbi:MAG TPA: sulfate adenylyltransferase [Sneathiellales bacterium]|nr:sulfate adenylyltransferase [Sneathiellales bacterium]